MFLRKQIRHCFSDTLNLLPDIGARRSRNHRAATLGRRRMLNIPRLLIKASFNLGGVLAEAPTMTTDVVEEEQVGCTER